MAAEISSGVTTILRRSISWMRSFSSISWRVICGRSRSSIPASTPMPVDSANSLARSSTSCSVTASPSTIATILSAGMPSGATLMGGSFSLTTPVCDAAAEVPPR